MSNKDGSITSLTLGCYTPEEIKKISVKEITSLLTIEPTLGKGAAGGLYDSSLGSLSDREPCRTCKLSYLECNGHNGHIQFSSPVYNPIFIDVLMKLIKAVCFMCHRIDNHDGILECMLNLKNQDDYSSIKKFTDFDDMTSLTKVDKERVTLKLMAAQKRKLCPFCNKKPLVFKKSRKAEILVHISNKVSQSKDVPDYDKRKCNETMQDMNGPDAKKIKLTNISETELYSKFTADETALYPELMKAHLRLLWNNESVNLKSILPMLNNNGFEYPTDIFFMDNMLINPPMNRLPAIMHGDQMTESPETTNMNNIVRANHTLRELYNLSGDITKEQRYQNIREGILELQKRVNVCFDSNIHREIGPQPGLRQKIDKKEGLFRKNIMGKRVNFACRSVISPDPTVGLDEIGVPIRFLKSLTFPDTMNELNKEYLMQCILNGPDVYPGAASYEIDSGKPFAINRNRESIVGLLELKYQEKCIITVNRHAIAGEVLIMNRQPTLHKLSMQAFFIKPIIDPMAKTLRMNYWNCKAFNADFDGDEMNGHYLQSVEAQAEAKLLVSVSHQHSTVKDGSPVAGDIQDRVITGTKACQRNFMLTRVEFLDILGFALQGSYTPPMKLLPPSIIKPQCLYTGKDLLTAIFLNTVPKHAPLPNIVCSEPKKNKLWNISKYELDLQLSDVELIIVDGYVCTGIFDKAHIGPSSKGLCNDLRELYGEEAQLKIMSCISRGLNRLLIYTGFSVSVKDGLLNESGNSVRTKNMNNMPSIGLISAAKAFGMKPDEIELPKLANLMEKAQFDKSDEFRNKMSEIDSNFKLLSNRTVNIINTACKKNLKEDFPNNNLSFMANIGAKGGDSNITKIAIALGAIEIEGKRCPLTISGKTLPSFKRYDFDPSARGFAAGRFTTGLNPQELFFESMAGRDGLVDTAVKTSSSGYLQRCLIKHMEDIAIRYDNTVRDNNDNIIQFKYGYDGLDVVKSVPLTRSDYKDLIRNNIELYKKKYHLNDLKYEGNLVNKVIEMKSDVVRVDPGEAVGILASQSIGEPSTQMTLNTFHNAGQSEMNVTLGIPRLREILMSGSEKIITPTMQVPILKTRFAEKNVELILKMFNKLRLKDIIQLPLVIKRTDDYEIKLSFKSRKQCSSVTSLDKKEMISLIEKTFIKSIADHFKKLSKCDKSVTITDCKDDEHEVALNESLSKDVDNDEQAEEVEPEAKVEDEVSDISDIEDDESIHDDEEIDDIENSDDEEEQNEKESDGEQAANEQVSEKKLSKVLEMCPKYFKSYGVHHGKNPKWIKLTINLRKLKIDLKSILLNLVETTVLLSVQGVDKALISAKDKSFVTEGYNHLELFKYEDIFDLNKFYSNNIVKMAKLYGIEAAVSCIEHEVKTVFKSYSIDVSSRHLRLIADYLTNSGSVLAFNRHSMKNHPSPIQRASYETALTVLNEMLIHGGVDLVKSPSSNIMFGQLVSHIGTNAMKVFTDN